MRGLLVLAVVLIGIGGHLRSSADECAAPPRGTELRGVWVTAWGDGFLTPGQADETIRLACAANLNTLIIQVRKVGDAYYNSAYEPRGENILGEADYDPLAYVIEKAHAAGLKVHAWINAFRVWRSADSSPDPRHVTRLHPDWLTRTRSGETRDADGQFLDPGVPEVKDYLAAIIADLIGKYDVDGVHLDFIRYPGRDFGYNAASIARFNAYNERKGRPRNDDPDWCCWRRDQVTETVRKIRYAVRSARPGVELTVSGITWGGCSSDFGKTAPYRMVYQDWAAWLKEGIVDAVIPMDYRDQRNPEEARAFTDWLNGMSRLRGKRHVYAGVMLKEDTASVVEQIKLVRKAGLNGVVVFAFNAAPPRETLAGALRAEVFQAPVIPPPMPWKAETSRIASEESGQSGR